MKLIQKNNKRRSNNMIILFYGIMVYNTRETNINKSLLSEKKLWENQLLIITDCNGKCVIKELQYYSTLKVIQ